MTIAVMSMQVDRSFSTATDVSHTNSPSDIRFYRAELGFRTSEVSRRCGESPASVVRTVVHLDERYGARGAGDSAGHKCL